jgi:uncharacterized protein YdaU (DUF1376 family)
MHYFYLQIKEWIANTAHLSHEEESAYFRLILHYYDSEQKIPLDPSLIFRKLRITNKDTGLAILDEFFTKTDDGWIHDRCDQEIARYHSMAEAGKRGAAKRWAKGGDALPIDPPMPIKNKELIIKNKDIDPPDGVSVDLWKDFLVYRKRMKSPVTPRVLARLIKEADIAKMSLSDVLETIIFKGWKSFDASWVTQKQSSSAPQSNQAWRTNDNLMIAKANELGLHTVGLQRFEIINKIDATLRSRGL